MQSVDNLKTMTRRDFVLYVIFLIAIAWGFELVPSGWLEVLTAEVSSRSLLALGFSSGWGVRLGEAYVTLAGGVRFVSAAIIRECTAMHVFAIFAGLTLPLRAGWSRKALSLVVAGPLLFAINISRVMLTILLTAYDVPPFAWVFTHPTVETYHYPLSFLYGLLGVALLVVLISRWMLPELGYTLTSILYYFTRRPSRSNTPGKHKITIR